MSKFVTLAIGLCEVKKILIQHKPSDLMTKTNHDKKPLREIWLGSKCESSEKKNHTCLS